MQRLSEEVSRKNRIEVALISDNYLNRVNQIKRNATNETIDDDETLFALDVLAVEKDMVAKLVKKDKVSRKVAVELRQALNYDEMMLLDTED